MKNVVKTAKRIMSVILVCTLMLCFMPSFMTASAAGYSNGYEGGPAGDGKGILAYGIDISKWQEDKINFTKLKAGGIDFVIIRAGYRNTVDPYFEYNYKAAKDAGLDVGVYWYSYAVTADEAATEAETCASVISGKKFEYPIYFDFEDSTQMSLSASLKKSICRKWLNNMANKGYLVGLYSMYSRLTGDLNPYTITPEYECWMARYFTSGTYDNYKDYQSVYGMWQYTESGKHSGYSGNLDSNVCFKDYPGIVKKYGFNGYTPAPTTFTLTFNANGGTGTMKDQEIEYGVSTSIRKNKFTNEGYDFYGWTTYRTATDKWRYTNGTENGWYKKGKQPDGYYLAIYEDQQNVSKVGLGTGDIVEMHAVWGSANYKVKYNANGGSGTMSNSKHVYGVQKALSANAFTKSDSTFAGWYMTRKSDGKTLYAMGDTQKWCIPGNQPDGYTLQLFNDQKIISKLSSVEGDVVTCTAQWTPKSTGTTTFYIDYNANGGTGTMERTTVVKGESTATTKCTFVRPGYKMTGWRAYRRSDDTWRVVGPDGTVKWCKYGDMPEGYEFKLYKNGGSLSGTSSVDCDIVTFFAEWEKDIVPGDTDLDGIVDINDATRIQKYLADLVDLSKEELEAADVNGDGVVNVNDVTYIQIMLAQ